MDTLLWKISRAVSLAVISLWSMSENMTGLEVVARCRCKAEAVYYFKVMERYCLFLCSRTCYECTCQLARQNAPLWAAMLSSWQFQAEHVCIRWGCIRFSPKPPLPTSQQQRHHQYPDSERHKLQKTYCWVFTITWYLKQVDNGRTNKVLNSLFWCTEHVWLF